MLKESNETKVLNTLFNAENGYYMMYEQSELEEPVICYVGPYRTKRQIEKVLTSDATAKINYKGTVYTRMGGIKKLIRGKVVF